jgi:hypothetical protein
MEGDHVCTRVIRASLALWVGSYSFPSGQQDTQRPPVTSPWACSIDLKDL